MRETTDDGPPTTARPNGVSILRSVVCSQWSKDTLPLTN